MTRGLTKLFDLPSMDEILEETEIVEEIVQPCELVEPPSSGDALIHTALQQIDDHARAMDDIYKDTLKHARDTADLAYDNDPSKAPRMLEVSAIHYKTAESAMNSKVEATMKMLKLINDRHKLNLDEQKMRHEMGNVPSDKADVIMVEDRNTLLRKLKEEAKEKKD